MLELHLTLLLIQSVAHVNHGLSMVRNQLVDGMRSHGIEQILERFEPVHLRLHGHNQYVYVVRFLLNVLHDFLRKSFHLVGHCQHHSPVVQHVCAFLSHCWVSCSLTTPTLGTHLVDDSIVGVRK